MKRLICFLALFLILAFGVAGQAGWVLGLDAFGKDFLRFGMNANSLYFFETVTRLGNTDLLAIFTVAVACLLWARHKRRDIIPFVGAAIISSLLSNGLKPLFGRPRPEYALIAQGGYSFPSGHATSMTVIYGLAIVLGCLYLRKISHKLLLGILLGTAIVLVSWSRVYLGVHYLSDVLGGIFLGLAQIGLFKLFMRW
ncbi:MAG: phosphatase PAP2 family protein [Turicibacter sp.]|nr:phosphatase PAP2 family protein [Turicibacter sp.]